jgi:hypothetical protein
VTWRRDQGASGGMQTAGDGRKQRAGPGDSEALVPGIS